MHENYMNKYFKKKSFVDTEKRVRSIKVKMVSFFEKLMIRFKCMS